MGFLKKVKNILKSDESPNNNFKYLDDLIHSGEKNIVLQSDIVIENHEKSEYSNGIKLDINNFVIDGNGYSIDAMGKARIFECSGEKIIIKNITLKNGFTQKKGGTIHNKGSLIIEESQFNDNVAKEGGGAIYNTGDLIIKKSALTQNTAKGKHFPDDKRRGGGAIINDDGNLTIINSNLSENTAIHGGGAIDNNKGQLIIIHSTLNKNTSKYGSGAIKNNDNLDTFKNQYSPKILQKIMRVEQ